MAIICKPHLRLSWGGFLGTPGLEVWTNSLALSGVTDTDSEGFSTADLQGAMPEIVAALTRWFTAGDSWICNMANLTWVKFNKIGADGKYVDNPNTYTLPAPIVGSKPGGTYIFQQSSVISLRTGQSRGRGSKGRIYPPICGTGVGGDGYMSGTVVTAMQASAVTLIGDINHIEPPTHLPLGLQYRWNVCIVSNEINGKPPLLTPVTHLYVDGIPDVQRRRVNRVKPATVVPTSVYINT